ncbi:DUF2986 domain-containing protein [uncultured Shewanella sp.]|uniref:DUF2986 domain-containing protein n=1 Tax=Shewanella atlantica TaxID=271099 RepID=UPI0026344B70|nr:DUF2986 domain-containing protein [uncultured Shewanella sp.]
MLIYNDQLIQSIPGRQMNRRKKINQTLKSKAKKANAKLHASNKPKYISKDERARLALEEQGLKAED